tara:strand:+ start:20034 stop:21893 length:1860 start_codon:yes stop_codon:yes gene_type:complete
MKKSMRIGKNVFVLCILFLFLIVLCSFTFAKENRITLLAVSESQNGTIIGATADLFLEIKPGQGRVFIDTVPLTKLDTQISTRFAKEIACDFIESNKAELGNVDCENYDFIYTIKSNAPIIGGPSAGAAISVLTISSLTDLQINDEVAITGTINSGGLIGVVSGIKEKIDAAADAGMTKVMIPYGTRYYKENKDDLEKKDSLKEEEKIKIDIVAEIDLKEYASEKNIELIEIEDLNEVMFSFTGKEFINNNKSLEINEKYVSIMKKVSEDLCTRSRNFIDELDLEITENEKEVLIQIDQLSNSSEKSYFEEKYYSSASYCFGANVKLNLLYLKQQNLSYVDAITYADLIRQKLINLEKEIDSKDIKSVSDLQTYMVVKERIVETKELLDEVKNNEDEDYLYTLAFAEERYFSALSWKVFFDSNIGKTELFKDEKVVLKLCQEKLEEAQERMNYLGLILPINLQNIDKEIDYAKKDLKDGNYELCLFKSLKAKAQANSILNMMSVKQEYVNRSIETKLKIIKNNINLENEHNIFPIMGYSYYEYADELKYTDIGSALLYAEYALELSNFHIYLNDNVDSQIVINKDYMAYIVIFLIGIAVGLVYNFNIKKEVKKKPKKNK